MNNVKTLMALCIAESESNVLCLEWRVTNRGVGGL